MRKNFLTSLTLIMFIVALNISALAAASGKSAYYDQNGNQITVDGMYYNNEGYPMFNSGCYYLDANGNPVYVGGNRAYNYDGSGNLTPCDYCYDQTGNAVNRPASNPGGWGCGSWYYDSSGNTVNGTFYYDNSGNRIDPAVYYDSSGNQITINGMYYNNQGNPTFNAGCYYLDANGNPVYVGGNQAYYYDAAGQLMPCDYYFDTAGNAVDRPASYPGGWGCGGWYYDENGSQVSGTFYYDNNGNQVDPSQNNQRWRGTHWRENQNTWGGGWHNGWNNQTNNWH